MAAGLTVFCVLVFLKGLGVPLPLIGRWFGGNDAEKRFKWIFSPIWLSACRRRQRPVNLLYCLIGVFLGTAIGVLPGLGPTATIAMLLP